MKWIIGGVIVALVAIFLWWTVAPAFIDVEVADELSPELQNVIELSNSEDTAGSELRTMTTLSEIIDTPGHPATGEVRVIKSNNETVVRYENYNGTNGPDLFVYLATDLDATEYVSLGRARGNMGNINYEVPADINIEDYQYVMTWCRAFGVLFDYAEIP